MDRLSVSLDEKSEKLLKKYEEKYHTSKAEVIRRALDSLDNVENVTEKVDFGTIKTYVDFLAKKEHIILDIAHWESIWNKFDAGSNGFWEEMHKIGEAHMEEYSDKGIKEIRTILEYIEKTNWYELNVDSPNSYTLMLRTTQSAMFVKTFFEGFFENYPRRVAIKIEQNKIRIKVA